MELKHKDYLIPQELLINILNLLTELPARHSFNLIVDIQKIVSAKEEEELNKTEIKKTLLK